MLQIKHDGWLSSRDGVVSSGGVLPVGIAIHNDLVYVANSGNGGSNYTGFRLLICPELSGQRICG